MCHASPVPPTDPPAPRASAALQLARELAADASARGGPPAASAADLLVAAVDERLEAGTIGSPDLLVAAGEHLVGARQRSGSIELGPRPSGVVYTPQDLAAGLVAIALDGAPAEARVLDPACGGGAFLLAALRHLYRAAVPEGAPPDAGAMWRALDQVAGIDVDPLAALLARRVLWLEVADPGLAPDDLAHVVRIADTLSTGTEHVGVVDVVVGNPPFLSPLRGAAPPAGADPDWAAPLGTYADHAALFLAWAHHHVDPDGGRVMLVQPASVLAGRDTAGFRELVDSAGELAGLWLDTDGAFPAAVTATAPLLVRGRRHDEVRLWKGRGVVAVTPSSATTGTPPPGGPAATRAWSDHAAAILGLPDLDLPSQPGTIGDVASATADFRDQYYGLVGHVVEMAEGRNPDDLPEGFAPLVTSGMIDPGCNAWGRREVRLHKSRWHAPAVDLEALASTELAGWVAARRVPKVVVAAQTRVVEAVVDEEGGWLPSVPTITVTAPPGRLWHVAAALNSPVVSALAMRAGLGTARTLGTLKLSATSLVSLPLPCHEPAWDAAVEHLRRASTAVAREQRDVWRDAMDSFGSAMARAYGLPDAEVEPLVAWWSDRLPDPFR